MLRDLDLLPQDHPDTRRLEVVADGLPLRHGDQLAINTTMVSPLKATEPDRRRKVRRYPELSGPFWESTSGGSGVKSGADMVCSAAKVFALSLLEARSCVSSDGCAPLTGEVISGGRYEPAGE